MLWGYACLIDQILLLCNTCTSSSVLFTVHMHAHITILDFLILILSEPTPPSHYPTFHVRRSGTSENKEVLIEYKVSRSVWVIFCNQGPPNFFAIDGQMKSQLILSKEEKWLSYSVCDSIKLQKCWWCIAELANPIKQNVTRSDMQQTISSCKIYWLRKGGPSNSIKLYARNTLSQNTKGTSWALVLL